MNTLEEIKTALLKRGFRAEVFASGKEAAAAAVELIGNASCGFGGSVTVNTLGIYDMLKENGNELHWHWKDADKQLAKKKAAECEYFLAGANAITKDGLVCNMDGTGNRCAALIYGPQYAILFAGKNKLVGSLDEARERIKKSAIANACRQNSDLPCVKLGYCVDCSNPNRSCNVMVIHERPPKSMKGFYVFLIDEELGL